MARHELAEWPPHPQQAGSGGLLFLEVPLLSDCHADADGYDGPGRLWTGSAGRSKLSVAAKAAEGHLFSARGPDGQAANRTDPATTSDWVSATISGPLRAGPFLPLAIHGDVDLLVVEAQ